jgi:predicted enzyme related to lactoylglutathione lyase
MQKFGHIIILVNDYDEAINFYVNKMGFIKLIDNPMGTDLRWVTVAPSKDNETRIVFVRADTPEKQARVGNQVANHIFIVLEADDCKRDYESMESKGVEFLSEPKQMPRGLEVVFSDLYGNQFDLLQVAPEIC